NLNSDLLAHFVLLHIRRLSCSFDFRLPRGRALQETGPAKIGTGCTPTQPAPLRDVTASHPTLDKPGSTSPVFFCILAAAAGSAVYTSNLPGVLSSGSFRPHIFCSPRGFSDEPGSTYSLPTTVFSVLSIPLNKGGELYPDISDRSARTNEKLFFTKATLFWRKHN